MAVDRHVVALVSGESAQIGVFDKPVRVEAQKLAIRHRNHQ